MNAIDMTAEDPVLAIDKLLATIVDCKKQIAALEEEMRECEVTIVWQARKLYKLANATGDNNDG